MSNNITKSGLIGRSEVTIERFTYGFEQLSIRQYGEGAALRIGAFCSLANATIFLGGNHRTDWVTTFPFGHIYQDELGGEHIKGHPATKGDVVIGSDVWVGSGVTIMSGVRIGHGAVLSANAMVVADVLPYEIVGGNPAKPIKKRFDDEIIDLLLTLKWWELPLDVIRDIQQHLSSPPSREMLIALIAQFRSQARVQTHGFDLPGPGCVVAQCALASGP